VQKSTCCVHKGKHGGRKVAFATEIAGYIALFAGNGCFALKHN
jgi:hypothetical protein